MTHIGTRPDGLGLTLISSRDRPGILSLISQDLCYNLTLYTDIVQGQTRDVEHHLPGLLLEPRYKLTETFQGKARDVEPHLPGLLLEPRYKLTKTFQGKARDVEPHLL